MLGQLLQMMQIMMSQVGQGSPTPPPVPDLPQDIIEKTSKKYQEVYDRLFG